MAEKYTIKEIAEKIGITPGALRARKYRLNAKIEKSKNTAGKRNILAFEVDY